MLELCTESTDGCNIQARESALVRGLEKDSARLQFPTDTFFPLP